MIKTCLGWCICLCVLSGAPRSLGHGDVHERITALNDVIARTPDNASNYKQRGSLWMADGNPTAALADFERSLALDPTDRDTLLLRSGALLKAGRNQEAIATAKSLIAIAPENAEAALILARALAASGDAKASVVAYDHVLALIATPSPDIYIEQARAAVDTGINGRTAAVTIIEHGIARLGPMVSLHCTALEYEKETGNLDAALARLDRMTALPGRSEHWLVEKGELLHQAGREGEALETYRSALQRLEQLPERTRRTPSCQELELRIKRGLNASTGAATP